MPPRQPRPRPILSEPCRPWQWRAMILTVPPHIAQAGLLIEPNWAKLHARRGAALFYLHRYGAAAEAYERALAINANSSGGGLRASEAEARSGLEMARKEMARAAAQASAARAPAQAARAESSTRDGPSTVRPQIRPPQPPPQPYDEEARRAADLAAYEADLAAIRKQRREAFARWKNNTGSTLDRPPQDARGGCDAVDVFGNLRGRCVIPGSSCSGWTARSCSGWSDTSVLFCAGCGKSNTDHYDCGPVVLEDPPLPASAARVPSHGLQGGAVVGAEAFRAG